jgi:RHS repeat-associated protein
MFSRVFAGGVFRDWRLRWVAGVTACVVTSGVVQATGVAQAASLSSKSPAVTQSPDAVSAMMTARKQGSRVEILSDRTAYAQTFANPNGTLTYVSSAVPRWVEQGSSWSPVDASLVANKDGSLSPKAAEAPLRLSDGGSGPLATAGSGSRTLSVSWPSALPRPSVSGAMATYPSVLPGVDLVVTASVTGAFEQTLVVKDAAAARNPALAALELKVALGKGLSQQVDKAGNVTVKDGEGKAVFASPAPVAWDSAGIKGTAVSGVRGPARGAHTAKVAASYGSGAVRMSVPQFLLAGSSTVFPLYVDPSYTVTQAWEGYDETQSAYPTVDELNNTFDAKVSVGFDGGGIDRGYYVLGLPSAADGATTQVLSATLATTVVTTYTNASTSHTVNAYYTSQVSDSTTWNTPPTQLAGPSATTFTTTSTAPNQTVNFDVASYVQSDLDGYGWQFSVGLINSSEADGNQFVEFANNPTLTITYDHAPWSPGTLGLSPQNWAPNGSLYTSSLTPTLQAATTDDDGDQVAYQFQVKQGSTIVASGTSGYYASGATGSWTVPSALSDGTTYAMYVRGYDGTEYGNWSSARNFTTDAATPAAPSVSCPGYPSGAWTALISGGTNCTFTDSSSMVAGYVYELQNGSGAPTWNWISGSSPTVTIDPTSSGLYTLTVSAVSDAGLSSTGTPYYFGVGTSGAMLAPADQSQTSTTVSLQAAAPTGFTSATFEYRYGSSGSFTVIPSQVVASCGCPVTWPVATSAGHVGVQSGVLTWSITRTLADDGPVQIEAVFTDGAGHTDTTDPVTVTLDRLGTGADYGTTSAGPVTVGLQSGNASLTATDVSIASYGAQLTVTRTFNSVAPSKAGIFGPGWVPGIASSTASSWASVTNDGSYALLTGGDGSTYSFTAGATNNGVTSYAGDGPATTAGLTLAKNISANTFSLTEPSGSATTFAPGGSSSSYVPTTITTPGTAKSVGYVYDATGRPLLVVAPDAASSAPSTTACPSPASASTWTTAGCRGLALSYDPTSGNVSEIDFVYVDSAGTFHRTAVADYSYDTLGKLVAAWDPRLATPLKNTYTYDETSTDADYGRITQVSPAQSSGSGALAPWHLTYDDTSSDVNYGKLLTVTRTHSATYGGGTATTTVGYSVPLTTSSGGPVNMDSGTVATWGQADDPTSAVAVWPPGHTPASPPTATDYEYATIHYYDADGREVNTATYVGAAWAVSTTEYDSYGNVVRELTAANRATALASGSPQATAQNLDTRYLYSCDNFGTIAACTDATQKYLVLTDAYGPAHTADVDGISETIRTRTADAYDAAAPNSDTDTSGNPYMLKTSETISASIGSSVPGSSSADARTTQYVYANGSDTLGWTLGSPLKTVTDPSGLAITKTTVHNENSSLYGGDNVVVDAYQPSTTSGGTAADTRTVYYTAGSNSVDASCGGEPQWAGLICKIGPAAQPADTSTIPTSAFTYNDYLSPLTRTDAYGSGGTRTTTYSYDAANRQVTAAITTSGAGMGASLPETKTVYSPNDGLPTDTQSVNSSGVVTADISSAYDDFGQVVTYTDASGTTSTFTYDTAGRVTSRYDGQATDTISYSPAGLPIGETDSLAGTFTANYNADGTLQTQTYPDGTNASYTTDATGTTVGLVYSNSNWSSSLTDTGTPNAEGDWTSQRVLNASVAYRYDAADRLTAVADTEAGSCVSRSYAYDADSNRAGLTTYGPASSGACQTGAGATETYSYDSADRLESTTANSVTSTYAYDTQGDVATTPSQDAGGSGNLSATYYVNGLLASQTQNGVTTSWTLDPSQNRYYAWASSSQTGTNTNHYFDSGDSPSWTTNADGSWTRNLVGPSGQLVAMSTSSGTNLQLVNLHGDVMASVQPANDTAPAATYTYTEFGSNEPSGGAPSRYGYLGGDQRSSTALGGTILMGMRGYNTASGRFDSADPIAGGSANAYDYAFQNPLTANDLTGMSGNRSGLNCWTNGRWGHCNGYLNDWQTQYYAYLLAFGAAVATACAWVFGMAAETGVGALISLFCGGAAAVAGITSGWLFFADWAGHSKGVIIHVDFVRFQWWWWGWHHRWIPDWGYIWHQ